MVLSGQVINGTYHIDRRLGCGGMADVFLVTHARLPRQFALKLLRMEIGSQRDFLDRFRREAEILASIRSAHIVDVVDWDYTYDGQPFIAMEYLEGETLSAFLQRTGAMPLAAALDIFAQIGEGLCAAHAVGVVHRDLKPSNIFLDRNGGRPNFVKILDFGIAKLTQDARTPLTAHASVMGTPGYMAPEQALGRVEQIDHRADQFSLAVILYEMLAGQPAFFTPGEALYRTLERVVHEEPPPLADSPLSRVLQRAMAKRPEERYGSLREFMDAVAAAGLLGQYPAQTLALPTYQEVATSELGERRRWLPIFASALLVGGGIIALGSLGSFGPRLSALRAAGQREITASRPAPSTKSEPASSPEAPAMEATREAAGSASPLPSAEPAPVKSGTLAAVSGAASKELVPGTRAAPLRLAEPAASSAAADAAAASRRGAAGPTRTFWFSGVDAAQERVLRVCAEKELRTLPGLPSGVIQLERSGALQVVQGPLLVHRSGLTSCLRQAFAALGSEPPRAATIHVLVARR